MIVYGATSVSVQPDGTVLLGLGEAGEVPEVAVRLCPHGGANDLVRELEEAIRRGSPLHGHRANRATRRATARRRR